MVAQEKSGLQPHRPHPRSKECVRSSRTRKMAAVQGNAGGTSSGSVEAAGAAAGDSVDGDGIESVVPSVPVLQVPPETEASIDVGKGKTVKVTLEEPMEGKRRLTSWTWNFVFLFSSRVPPEYALSSWHVPGFRSHRSVRLFSFRVACFRVAAQFVSFSIFNFQFDD